MWSDNLVHFEITLGVRRWETDCYSKASVLIPSNAAEDLQPQPLTRCTGETREQERKQLTTAPPQKLSNVLKPQATRTPEQLNKSALCYRDESRVIIQEQSL